jgi:hypothetical protein
MYYGSFIGEDLRASLQKTQRRQLSPVDPDLWGGIHSFRSWLKNLINNQAKDMK